MKLALPYALGWFGAWVASAALAGCLGDLKVTDPGEGGSWGTGGTGGDAGAGMGGSGGTGGGAMVCEPSSEADCNTGQPGICADGNATCNSDGMSYGACAPKNAPSFDDCRTVEDEDCDGMAISQCTGAIEWTFTPGGPDAGLNDEILTGIVAMPGGKFVVTGVVDGDIALGPDVKAGALYLAKLEPDGMLIWEKKFAGSGAAAGRAVAADADGNVFVAGDFSGSLNLGAMGFSSKGAKDVLIAKFNTSGTVLWAKSFGDAGTDLGYSIATDASGNVFVTGKLDGGTFDLGGGPIVTNGDDLYLVSYDPQGNHRWSRVFVAPNGQQGRGLAVSPEGDVVVVGDSNGNITFGGGTHVNNGGSDCFIAKFNGTTGEHIWSKTAGASGDQHGRVVTRAPNGNFLFGGRFNNQVDFGDGPLSSGGATPAFIVEFDGATGNVVRQMKAGQTGTTYIQGLAVDGAGNVIAHGAFDGTTNWGGISATAAGAQDAFLAKLDANSWVPLWFQTFPGANDQLGFGVALDSVGRAFAVGYFATSIDFGGMTGTIPSTGGLDRYAISVAP